MDYALVPLVNGQTRSGLPYTYGVKIDYEVPDDYPALLHALTFLTRDFVERSEEGRRYAPIVLFGNEQVRIPEARRAVEADEFYFPVHLKFLDEDREVFRQYLALLEEDAAIDAQLDEAHDAYTHLGKAFYDTRKPN